mgnify:CR=1 FL=1
MCARGERARWLDAIGQMRYCRRSRSRFSSWSWHFLWRARRTIVFCMRSLPNLPSLRQKPTRFRCSPLAYYLSVSVLLSAAVPVRAPLPARSNVLAKFPEDSWNSPPAVGLGSPLTSVSSRPPVCAHVAPLRVSIRNGSRRFRFLRK